MTRLLSASLFLLFIACSGGEKKETSGEAATKTEVGSVKKYACPMKCEGEKTYAEAGKCPVCKMDLQEIAMAETDSSAHKH
jgi:hypothetical protein